jgi:hypothetical protein
MTASLKRYCQSCNTAMGEQACRISGAVGSTEGAFRIVYYCPNEDCPGIENGLTPGFVIVATEKGEMTEAEWTSLPSCHNLPHR